MRCSGSASDPRLTRRLRRPLMRFVANHSLAYPKYVSRGSSPARLVSLPRRRRPFAAEAIHSASHSSRVDVAQRLDASRARRRAAQGRLVASEDAFPSRGGGLRDGALNQFPGREAPGNASLLNRRGEALLGPRATRVRALPARPNDPDDASGGADRAGRARGPRNLRLVGDGFAGSGPRSRPRSVVVGDGFAGS